jgi:hypothetical protein
MAGAFTQAFNLCRRLRYPDGWCISPCDDGGLKAIRRRDHHTLRISWKPRSSSGSTRSDATPA